MILQTMRNRLCKAATQFAKAFVAIPYLIACNDLLPDQQAMGKSCLL